MDRTAGKFRVSVSCPYCRTGVVFAQNGEMNTYTENYESFARYGWDRVSYCPHITIDGGLMTVDEVRAIATDPRAWKKQ